ncbi:Cytohesin-interacting protein [Dirofilaria immitis]
MFNWSLSISSTTLKSVKSLSPSTSSSFSRTFLENITRSPFYHSLTSLDKTKLWSKFYVDDEENVQKVLDVVSVDQKVITNPHSNRRRRTVIVTRNNDEPFGFTLQTYLLKRKGDDVPSKVTYVDYVQLDSPAADAGIRAGDMIISINGHVVTAMSHEELIKLIGSYHQMRMVVIFENIRQHIELVARAIKLRKILNDKLYQLNLIDIEEQKILNRAYLRSLSTKKITHSLLNSLSSATTSSVSSSISSISNTEAQFLPVQRIRCYESDLENIDRISSSSCDTGQTVDPLVRFDNSHDDDDISNDGSKNCTAIENADNNVVDNDGDNDIAISDDFVGINCNDDNDKISAFDSIILPDNVTTVAAQIPISESMFHSIGLNHVIMLNDDVVSGEDDDDSDKIRILKL